MENFIYKSQCTFSLEKPYYDILLFFVESTFDKYEFSLQRHSFLSLTNKTEDIEEIFAFIDRYGAVSFSEIVCLCLSDREKVVIEIKNEKVHNYDYFYDTAQGYKKDIEYFKTIFKQEKLIDYHISKPASSLEKTLSLAPYDQNKNEAINEIFLCLKNNYIKISFFFHDKEIILRSFDKKCEVIPFVKSVYPSVSYPVKKRFLLLGTIDLNEKRKVVIKNNSYIFFEGFMKFYKENENIYQNTKVTSSCTQCIHRIKSKLLGCETCNPKKIHK